MGLCAVGAKDKSFRKSLHPPLVALAWQARSKPGEPQKWSELCICELDVSLAQVWHFTCAYSLLCCQKLRPPVSPAYLCEATGVFAGKLWVCSLCPIAQEAYQGLALASHRLSIKHLEMVSSEMGDTLVEFVY